MSIEESNLIIAEFLGWHKSGLTYYSPTYDYSCTSNTMKFHSDWNWLMQCIDFIEKLETEFDGRFVVYIHSNCCSIQSTKLDTRPESPHYSFAIFDICLNTKIESVYYCALQFISWWNQNHKK